MANSTTNTQTAPSPPESLWEYNVFLSFRGSDTRNNFTDHLCTALRDKEIVTFRDTEGLDAGKPISELLNAIKKSRMAVVILSENYASSTWCLKELAKIVERMDAGRMRVYPIFYHVDPSDVRHLKGTFTAAFAKHAERFPENKVQRWRDAFRRVADLRGYPLNHDQPESQFISSFVEKVSSDHLNGTIESSVYEDKYAGIKSRVEEIVNLYIDMESKDDVRFIGICGMSGIGKTTIAQAVFEMTRHQFEASSFLRDVKGRDLNDSQDQLLRDMKLKSEIPRWDELKAINTTSLRLRKKRVIIVVDDADEKRLETLAGHRGWFGPGSRIIITSEDKGLLEKRCGEKNVYKAKKLSAADALQLFIRQAFDEPPCGKDLLDICNGFVRYVDGHPLALKILGSSMYGITNIDQWEAELERVRKSPELPKDERNIQKVLRMSYNRLSTPKKKLFLDVACFLNGEDKDRISDILEDPGKCIPEIDIKALIDKSLITVLGGKLWIHNLLQQMGWEIVKEECMEKPEKRSRLWLDEDVLEVLNDSKGTDSIEGILLNAPAHKQVRLNADAFSKMKNLRLLRICSTAHLPQGLNYLSNELHLMEWYEYPLKSMPRSFQPDNLIEVIMPGSLIEQLPEEFSNLGKLKVIDLRDSQNLIKTPNFTRLSNLERAIFQGCTRLEEVHPSIGVHKRITRLNLKDCKCLDRLPPEINLESLKTLDLSGCSRLKKFPEIGRNMTSLWELYLDRTAVEELPLSTVHLTGLSLLNLQDCNNFSSFPSVICSLTSLQTLILSGFKVRPAPNSLLIKSLSGLGSLVALDLSDCNMEDGALPDDISCLSSLQSLNLSKNHFTCLPESISQIPKLKVLYLDNCNRLESLANIPLSTQSVMARNCTSLINYSNQIIVWTSGEPGLTFINCLNSADDIDEESIGSELSLRDIHFKPLLQRYMEGQICQVDGMYSISPQTEIPKWFTHQNKSGSSVPIRLPDNLDENYSSWRGIALFIVFKVKNFPRGQDLKSFHEFIYHLDNDGGLQDYPLIIINVPKDKLCALSYGLRLYVSNERFRDHLDERGCISPSITINSSDVEIQKCGARLVYEEDIVEFVQNLTQETSGSPEHLCPRQESIEYPMNPSPSNVDEPEPSLSSGQTDSNSRKKRQPRPSGQSYSSPRLNRQLKSLLSLLYQGVPARYHCYEYIFPQVKMAAPPRWFNYQNVSSVIRMELPSNLNDNTRWLGFTVYALFTLPKQPACSGDNQGDSMICVTFSDVLGGDPVGAGIVFALSRDIFVGSHRLLMFYMPREVFKLNGCSHIQASFESNNPSVDITMCGIRAVYEEDVDEFVQTLVECFVGCPDAYHDSIYGNLLDQVAMSQGCKHGEDFRCSFASQRWPQYSALQAPPSGIENVEEEEDCTSPETFPNQEFEAAGTSRNSRLSKISLGIPFRDGHSGSEETKRMLHTWFKRYVQDHCNHRGVYNHCFPEREIPKWFNRQNKGNSVTTGIPQNLFSDRNWMGFAICAVFPFHKHPTAVRRNLESGFPHRVICKLQTDIGGMKPIPTSYSISEDEVLISLYQRAFLWLSFTPSGNWMGSDYWNQMSWAKFSFLSDTPDVSSAVKCGVNLVYRHNFDDFARTIVQLLTSYADYMHLIRNSSKKNEPTVYKMLPMYHENVPRPHSSTEEDSRPPTPRRVPIHPFHPEHSSLGTPKPFYQTGPLDIKEDKIYTKSSASSLITAKSSYADNLDPIFDLHADPPDLAKEAALQWDEFLPEPFAEEGIEKQITSESQGMVFGVETVEMKSSGEKIGVEFEASGQDKKFEIEDIGIEPETSDIERNTISIIQGEAHQLCLMWGGLGLTETPNEGDLKKVKEIYLMHNELSSLPENPRCPMLLALFLNGNRKLRTIPPSFFDNMPALQILNLSRTSIRSLPESIVRLVNLKRLFLSYCHHFMRLSPKVGELKQLEVLDLEGTDIMDLPKEIKELTNLTCLEVSFCADLSNVRRAMQSDVVVPCGIISALSHLEELNMSVNPDEKRWSACVEAIVTEVCTLESLNTLKFYFPRVELVRYFLLNSPMWVHPSLSNFRFTVGYHVKRTMSRLPGDVEFELERWERCLKYINGAAVPRDIQKVLQYSTAFFLERHATVKKLSDFGIGNMKQLKCCVVGECNEVEVIIDATDAHEEDSEADAHKEDSEADDHEEDIEANAHEEDDEVEAYREDGSSGIVSKTYGAKTIILGSLEYLNIFYMKNLRMIWEGTVQPKCLSLLKSLTLRTCPQLTTIFTIGLLDNLYNLEELTVEDCPSVKTLVSYEISAEHKTSNFLPNLKRISLHYMPGLISISSGLHIAPRLEWLSFYNCPNLKRLLIEEVSSKDLKKIKGEWNWWVALKWRSGRPSYLDDIFVPINV